MANILVIEDDDGVREMIRRALERVGHNVREARDGRSGLKAIQAENCDLLVTDIVMPGMEGIETIIQIRKRHPQMKIIAISGGGMGKADDYLAIAAKCGANRTQTKPFSMAKMAEIANEVLETI